jgi:hypothetical protein
MATNYSYRMDHDTGFAPHVGYGLCTLCGCKITTLECWAEPGSWVIGIGGKGTNKSNALIYAMEVQATPTLGELRRRSPRLTRHLSGHSSSLRVLVSRRFYYFGNNAITLPRNLGAILIRYQGCKKLAVPDVAQLLSYLASRFSPGRHGTPNNATDTCHKSAFRQPSPCRIPKISHARKLRTCHQF